MLISFIYETFHHDLVDSGLKWDCMNWCGHLESIPPLFCQPVTKSVLSTGTQQLYSDSIQTITYFSTSSPA